MTGQLQIVDKFGTLVDVHQFAIGLGASGVEITFTMDGGSKRTGIVTIPALLEMVIDDVS